MAVKDGMGINRAALDHEVPRTTLQDRVSGRVIHGTNSGPKPYLMREEEEELVGFLLHCARQGYGKTRGEVFQIMSAAMKKKRRDLNHSISQEWWCHFWERWPALSLRKGDSFSLAREKMTCPEVFKSYFEFLKEPLLEYNLMDKPSQIHNCDESGMPLEH